MIQYYRKKVFALLIILLFTFSLLFLVTILNPNFNFIEFGLPAYIENYTIALFSFIAILFVLYEMKGL